MLDHVALATNEGARLALVCMACMVDTHARADIDELAYTDTQLASVIEELYVGESGFASEPLELQVVARESYGKTSHADHLTTGFEAELGLSDELQVGLETVGGMQSSTAVGQPSSVEANVLWSFFSSAQHGVALSTGLAVARAGAVSAFEREGAYGMELLFVAYKSLGPVCVNLTLSPELERTHAGETELASSTALSLIMPAAPLAIIAEVGLELGDERIWSVATGVAWHPSSSMELGAAALGSQWQDERSVGFQVLVAYEWEASSDDEAGSFAANPSTPARLTELESW